MARTIALGRAECRRGRDTAHCRGPAKRCPRRRPQSRTTTQAAQPSAGFRRSTALETTPRALSGASLPTELLLSPPKRQRGGRCKRRTRKRVPLAVLFGGYSPHG